MKFTMHLNPRRNFSMNRHPGCDLTCAESEPQASDVVAPQPVVIPHRDLHAGFPEVVCAEAVVHHGVVEHRVGRPLHHPRLLAAFTACVRKNSAEEKKRAHQFMLITLGFHKLTVCGSSNVPFHKGVDDHSSDWREIFAVFHPNLHLAGLHPRRSLTCGCSHTAVSDNND